MSVEAVEMSQERDITKESGIMENTHETKIPGGCKTDVSLPALFTLCLFIHDIPNLDQLVHSSCSDTSSNMWVNVESCGRAVVCC